jgi:protein gp37
VGETTKISWCHATFNPWRGCSHAVGPNGEKHPGCLNCYAEFLVCDKFEMGGVKGEWGPGAPRTVAAESGWALPVKWALAAAKEGVRRRVFFSLGDPLDEEAPKQAQERFWDLIRETAEICSLTGQHPAACECTGGKEGGLDWLLLTKRPWRWELIPEDVRPLVWLGTSISDQATTDVWVPALLKAEGFRLRFISAEPLLGPVRLDRYICRPCSRCDGSMSVPVPGGGAPCPACLDHQGEEHAIHWVIAGGESGANRRPAELHWYQGIADSCGAAKVPFYMKQDTAFRAGQQGRIPDALWALKQVPGEAVRHGA